MSIVEMFPQICACGFELSCNAMGPFQLPLNNTSILHIYSNCFKIM